MQGLDVVNRLKDIIPLYTNDFSDIANISSLSVSGSTITAITTLPHSLTTNDYITIRGAKEPIALSSITRVDNIVTVVSLVDHKLSDPSLYSKEQLPIFIELSGVTPAGYNGTFQLLTVPNGLTFTFKINTAPTTPATVAGFLLRNDFDSYNQSKQVTVINTTTFTYPTTAINLQTPAQGNIVFSTISRIDHAATPQRILDYYSESQTNILQNWMFVVMGSQVIYRDGTVASDLTSAKMANESYYYEAQQNFSIFVILPSKNSILGGAQADKSRSYLTAILKSIANYSFPSPLTDIFYQPATFVGDDEDDYVKAYYVHRFDFSAKGYVTNEDTAVFNDGVPLQLIDETILGKDMKAVVNFR